MSFTSLPLGEIAEINPSYKKAIDPETEVSFLGMADVSELGTTTPGVTRRYGEVRNGYTPFYAGDVLVAKIAPCFQNGKIAQAQLEHEIGAGSTEFHVVRPKQDADARYLLRFLRQHWIRIEGELRMTGSGGQRRVPEAYLRRLMVPLPPLAEQKRIAAALDHLDALRAMLREAIALLDDLAQSVFVDMFGDPIVNSRGWPRRKLGKMGTLDRGVSKHRPRNDPALLGGEFPLIQTGDVAGSGGYITSFTSTYSDIGLNQSRIWPAGTLCITIAANIAKAGILTFDACFPDSVVGFTASPAKVEYIRAWLSFLQETLEASASESAQKNINLAVLRGLEIPYPGEDLIRVFSERVKAIEASKGANRTHLAALDELFTSLEQRAFTGMLWNHEATGDAA
ncbi:restriction endonuclease subunit S [Streptomyces sp. SID3212]|uniref:restriction endonuclease subunit S n=1 Tax=Streptomyces sp. SID3212 TaxID=2690259 RepID=UPI001927BF3D|nr:restriction endonuclease subunit S [Streptomyces sp. SID3212]